MKCFMCQKEINPQNGRHITWCAGKNGIDRDTAKFKNICLSVGFEITPSFLEEEYLVNAKSFPQLKKEYGLSFNMMSFLLRKFDIKARDQKEAVNTQQHKEKYKSTCLSKYGVANVSYLSSVKEKKKKTSMKNYGVDNIWKRRDIILQRMVEKYGKGSVPNINDCANAWGWKTETEEGKRSRIKKAHVGYKKFWESLSDEEKTEIIRKRCDKMVRTFKSSLESRIQKVLTDIGIGFVWQKWISQKSFDFMLSGTRILIEVQGDFWHCNPSLYQQDDIVKFLHEGATARDVWEKDDNKRKLAESYGYRVIYLWERDMNSMTDLEIANYILGELDENQKD